MKLRLQLYGALSDAGLGRVVALDVAPDATARQVLAALEKRLAGRLGRAVLATDREVLAADSRVGRGRLAVLPPVCGG